tara:strand:- start:484 stop:1851 length:1368 start_codon:yes stop_codon:yes gene_type:complete
MKIRTRFAPSPTGFLHVGGLRTALYNFLFAKKNKGVFVLRIEDTDQDRLIPNAAQNLIKTLEFCGLNYDEGPNQKNKFGPYTQSKRLHIYKKYILQLINNKQAYPCFFKNDKNDLAPEYDIQTALERMQNEQFVVKFKLSHDKNLKTFDEIRGDVIFDVNLMEDPIILKSDGYPTYHFANVIDDHCMKISHVIRGEEWLPSLPKHILLYNAFNWDTPKFYHLPLLLNPDKSKLSKRQGDVGVEDFLKNGYLKESIINFVALLGWHPSNNQEIFSIDELVNSFSMNRINKSGAVFDKEKLNWMNRHYLKAISSDDCLEKIQSMLSKKNIIIDNKIKLKFMIEYAQNRVNTLNEIINEIMCFIECDELNLKLLKKFNFNDLGRLWINEINNLNSINKDNINNIITKTSNVLKITGKQLFIPLRLMLINKEHGPDLFTIINILGIDESIKRIKRIEKI